KEPEQRYATIGELIVALEEAVADAPPWMGSGVGWKGAPQTLAQRSFPTGPPGGQLSAAELGGSQSGFSVRLPSSPAVPGGPGVHRVGSVPPTLAMPASGAVPQSAIQTAKTPKPNNTLGGVAAESVRIHTRRKPPWWAYVSVAGALAL